MKQKTGGIKKKKKQEWLQKKDIIFVAFFLCVMLSILPLIVLSFYSLRTCDVKTNTAEARDEIRFSLDKRSYGVGEKISLGIINSGSRAVYLEPCGEMSIFEKKEGKDWKLVGGEAVEEDLGKYEGFNKKNSNTSCQIGTSGLEAGVYRLVVPIFYECSQANRYACKSSEVLYTDSFEILKDNKSVCVSSSLEDCDGRRIEVSGILQEDGGIYYMSNISDFYDKVELRGTSQKTSDGVDLKSGTIYEISGVFHKTTEVCADSGSCIEGYNYPYVDIAQISVAN